MVVFAVNIKYKHSENYKEEVGGEIEVTDLI
jgi:hypothetical protein